MLVYRKGSTDWDKLSFKPLERKKKQEQILFQISKILLGDTNAQKNGKEGFDTLFFMQKHNGGTGQ